jgi:hypothetical protein
VIARTRQELGLHDSDGTANGSVVEECSGLQQDLVRHIDIVVRAFVVEHICLERGRRLRAEGRDVSGSMPPASALPTQRETDP